MSRFSVMFLYVYDHDTSYTYLPAETISKFHLLQEFLLLVTKPVVLLCRCPLRIKSQCKNKYHDISKATEELQVKQIIYSFLSNWPKVKVVTAQPDSVLLSPRAPTEWGITLMHTHKQGYSCPCACLIKHYAMRMYGGNGEQVGAPPPHTYTSNLQ